MKKAFFALTVIAMTPFTGAGTASLAQGITNSISTQDEEAASQKFSTLVRKLVKSPPDDCSGPVDAQKTGAALEAERQIFDLLSNAVLTALNEGSNGAAERTVQTTLNPFQSVADQVAASWTSDKRLRYTLLPVQPLLVLKLTVWNQATFIVYAPSHLSGTQPSLWEIAMHGGMGDAPFENLEMFTLWRGPSENPRLLVVKHLSDCMAGMTYDYIVDAYEWNGEQGQIAKILEKTSEFSEGYRPGKLQTSGSKISVPYCWSGALHFTSASAPICSLDTYDLSGDALRLISTQNDPDDLSVIEKVIESARTQNLATLGSYSKSSDIARRIIKVMPLDPFFDGYSRKQLGAAREQLDLSGDQTLRFVLQKRGSSWLLADFDVDN